MTQPFTVFQVQMSKICFFFKLNTPSCHEVGRSQDRFPVVSLDFSVTYFLPTVPWPWGRLNP